MSRSNLPQLYLNEVFNSKSKAINFCAVTSEQQQSETIKFCTFFQITD